MFTYSLFFSKETIHPQLALGPDGEERQDLDVLPDDMLVEIIKNLPLSDQLTCRKLSIRYCKLIDANTPELPLLFAIAQRTKEILLGNRNMTIGSYAPTDQGFAIKSLGFDIYPVMENRFIKYQDICFKTRLSIGLPILWSCISFYHLRFDDNLAAKKLNQAYIDMKLCEVHINFEDDRMNLTKRTITSIDLEQSTSFGKKEKKILAELIQRLPVFDVADKVIGKSS